MHREEDDTFDTRRNLVDLVPPSKTGRRRTVDSSEVFISGSRKVAKKLIS